MFVWAFVLQIFLGTVAVGEIKPGFSLSTQQWAIEEVRKRAPKPLSDNRAAVCEEDQSK